MLSDSFSALKTSVTGSEKSWLTQQRYVQCLWALTRCCLASVMLRPINGVSASSVGWYCYFLFQPIFGSLRNPYFQERLWLVTPRCLRLTSVLFCSRFLTMAVFMERGRSTQKSCFYSSTTAWRRTKRSRKQRRCMLIPREYPSKPTGGVTRGYG